MKTETSTTTYFVIYAALIVLTLATCGLSFVPHFDWHTSVGLAIASAKVILIALFFMHLVSSTRLIWLALFSGLAWLSILFGLTLADYVTRGVLSF